MAPTLPGPGVPELPPRVARASGRTRASATAVMKLVSAFQRGSTWTWRWPATPAPAAAPRLSPTLTPLGPVRRLERDHRVGDRAPTARPPPRRPGPRARHLAVGHHQHVAAGVREAVEDGEARLAPLHDVASRLVGHARREDACEDRALARRGSNAPSGRLGDVGRPPARPTGDPSSVRARHVLASTSAVSRATKSSTGTPRSTSPPRGLTPTVPRGHVVVAHHEHVGELLELGPPDAGAERLVGLDLVGPETLGPQPVGDAARRRRCGRRAPGAPGPAAAPARRESARPCARAARRRTGRTSRTAPGGSPGAGGARCRGRRTRGRSGRGTGSRPGWWTSASAGRWRRARGRRSWGRRTRASPSATT